MRLFARGVWIIPNPVRLATTVTREYEIATAEGNAVWGGEDPHSAVQWLRQSPLNSRLLVSCWEAGEEDARLIIEPIDITKIVFAVMAGAQ